jgi:hypothetical protein
MGKTGVGKLLSRLTQLIISVEIEWSRAKIELNYHSQNLRGIRALKEGAREL